MEPASGISGSPAAWGVIVIGCSWGANLARAAARRPDVRLRAVVDLDRDKAERLAAELDVAAFADYRATFSLPDVNVALVAVPAESHKAVSDACIERKLHVYLEKPCGHERRPDEVTELAARAAAAGLRFMPGFSQRFAPYAATAVDVVHSGVLGTVLSVDILRQADFGPTWSVAPGWGIHDYDLCSLLAGAPPAAVTALAPRSGGYALGHTTEVLVEHVNGSISRCKTSMFATQHEVNVRVHGDRGELVSEQVGSRTRVWTRARAWEIVHHKAPEFWETAIEKFFDYLGGAPQPVPPDEVRQGRRILAATWQSLEQERRIPLD